MTAAMTVPEPVEPAEPDKAGESPKDGADGAATRRDSPEPVRGRNVPLDPGAVVGEAVDCRWQVVRHVADGGFSSVYRVRPASDETKKRFGEIHRALKCLWGTPAELSHIGSEADKMAAVDGHDNVLGLVTSFRFQRSEQAYSHYVGLVLELAGEDLYQFGQRVSPPERAWSAVFEQVAAGLEHIHARRIVHGDIKPTNLLRVDSAFKIGDFGVSAPLETTRSAGIGLARTIAFWPPESRNQGVLDQNGVRRPPLEGWRATQMGDVWALAVSMHRLLTGRHIATGATPDQQYELVCAGRYTVDDRLGPGWRKLLSDCLVLDPEQRVVTTAADLRSRLAELALSDDYRSVPWVQGAPRVVALLDGVVDHQTLVLYLAQEGGRAQGRFAPRGDVLLDTTRHLHQGIVPALAQQVRDSQRAAVRLAEEQERMREAAARSAPTADAAAQTRVIREKEMERTRQLSVAVAEVTRQRDQAARERDRAARRSETLMAERDRIAGQYAELSRRLDRLERTPPRQQVVAYPPAQVAPRPVAPVAPVRGKAPRRRSGVGCLAWFWALVFGLLLGTVIASQILYDDPWSIFVKVFHAIPSTR